MKNHRVSCAYNIDTACVEIRYDNGTILAIDCIAVENQFAHNMYERAELDYLIYNDPAAYAELILCGDPAAYLRIATDYRAME